MQRLACNFLLLRADTTGFWVVSYGCQVSPNYREIVKLRLQTSTLQSCVDQSCTEVIWRVLSHFPVLVSTCSLSSNGAAFHFQHVSRAAGLLPTSAPVAHHCALVAKCCWVTRICRPRHHHLRLRGVSLGGFNVYSEHLIHAWQKWAFKFEIWAVCSQK